MARVTVEDCVLKVPNRFELVLFAAHRARGMSAGAEIMVDRDNDKNPVVALREIADTSLNPSDIKEELVESLQKGADTDDIEELETPALGAPPPSAKDVFGTPEAAPTTAEEPTGDMSEEDILAALNAMGGEDDPEKTSDSD